MSSTFRVITPPSVEPITLSDVKNYLNVDFDDLDATIAPIITSAREYIEHITGRALATQVIQQTVVIERPLGGVLSGTIGPGPNWYQFQQEIGANPFGPTQFYHDLSMPPFQISQPFTAETKVTAFDDWTTFTLVTNPANYWIDDNSEPARFYIKDPQTANFWRFTFTAGYAGTYIMPRGLLQCLKEAIAYWFEFREAQDLPQALIQKILAYRVDMV
jgi:Phage QLRG family, putative DNA packaging.